MAQTLGIVEANWRGTKIDCKKGSTISLGGEKRSPVNTGRRTDWTAEWENSEIEITTVMRRGGPKVTDLYATPSGELQIITDIGTSYVFPDAFLSDRPTFTGGDGGELKMKWAAGSYEELTNG